MTTPICKTKYYVHIYQRRQRKEMVIDFDKGLGRFLMNYGVLTNRVLLSPGEILTVEPGYTYRRYIFNTDTHRFIYDLEFSSEDFDKPDGRFYWGPHQKTGVMSIFHEGRHISTLGKLGVYNRREDLDIILSKKAKR